MELWFGLDTLSPTYLLALVLTALLIVWDVVNKWKNSRVNAYMSSLPGPPALPIIGSMYILLGIKKNDILAFLRQIFKKWPNVGGYWAGNVPYIAVTDRNIINMELWFGLETLSPTYLLALVLTALLIIWDVVNKWKNSKVNAYMSSLPGPPALPIIGSFYILLRFKKNDVLAFLRELFKKWPNVGGYWAGNVPYIAVTDRHIINSILMSTRTVSKPVDYEWFDVHATGIFASNGEKWRFMRKTINPSFQNKVLASFEDIFRKHSKGFLEKLQKYADEKVSFDAITPVHLCTIDFVCETMMGVQMDVQKRDLAYLSTNLDKSTSMIFQRVYNFVLWPDIVYEMIGKKKQLDSLVAGMRSLSKEMVEKRKKMWEERKEVEAPTEDNMRIFLDNLLRQVDLGKMKEEQLVEEVVEMFIAGSVTTATTNAWLCLILGMYPDIQKKIYQEIMDVCSQRDITLEDVTKFNYLDMVVKEILRHFTIPFVVRDIDTDHKIDEKSTIPAGVRMVICLYNLHHDPQYWEKPNEFYPEHFLPETVLSRPKGAFLPFLNGPRICVGNKYAMQSIKYLMATVIKHFEFTSDVKPPKDYFTWDYRSVFMLWPTTGFQVQTKCRDPQLLNIALG